MSGFIPTLSHPSGPGKFCDSTAKFLSDARACSDPKDITHEEYHEFYHSTFKNFAKPIGWQHFSGDADGTSFKGLLFLPEKMLVVLGRLSLLFVLTAPQS